MERSTALQPATQTMKVRSVFVSDVHLGTRGCQAELLLDFLRQCHCEHLYLLGDIVDGWRLRARWYWPSSHDAVVSCVLARARDGVRVHYLPGNHDAFLRASAGASFGGVEIVGETIHEAADGLRYLLLHGDRFDRVATHTPWLAHVGDVAYRALLAASVALNRLRRRRGLAFWSLSAWAKLKVKEAVNFISYYEARIADEARSRGVHGVLCGHIHHAAMRDQDGVRYINTGDWVESCTAVVEHFDGSFEIVRWPQMSRVGRSDVPGTHPRMARRARMALRRRLGEFAAVRPARGRRRRGPHPESLPLRGSGVAPRRPNPPRGGPGP